MHHTTNRVLARELLRIAWIIEFALIFIGLLVSFHLSFFSHENKPSVAVPSLIFFSAIAVSEFGKIPLSKVTVSNQAGVFTRLIAFLFLLLLCFLSAEALLITGDIVQKERLAPITKLSDQINRSNDQIISVEALLKNTATKSPAISEEELDYLEARIHEVADKNIALRKQEDKIITGNNSNFKNLSRNQLSKLRDKIATANSQLEQIVVSHQADFVKLRTYQANDLKQSLFRDGAIRKEYREKMLQLDSRLRDERAKLEQFRDSLLKQEEALLLELRSLEDLSPSNKKSIEAIQDEIKINNLLIIKLQERKNAILEDRNNHAANSLNTRNNLLDDLAAAKENNASLMSALARAKDDNFIYRVAGYSFGISPAAVNQAQYSLINSIFIFSIAIILSALPSCLAAISTCVKSDSVRKDKVSKWARLGNAVDKLYTKVEKSRQRQRHQRDHNLQKALQANKEKDAAKTNKINALEATVTKLRQELMHKPEVITKEVEVEKVVYKPKFIHIPVPPLPEEQSFLGSLWRNFNTRKEGTSDET